MLVDSCPGLQLKNGRLQIFYGKCNGRCHFQLRRSRSFDTYYTGMEAHTAILPPSDRILYYTSVSVCKYLSCKIYLRPQTIEYIISRLNTALEISHAKCPQFSREKNGGHFEKRAAIGRRNTPHHSYTSGSKKVSACVRNRPIVRVNFRQYFVCLRERIGLLNCCNVLMLS